MSTVAIIPAKGSSRRIPRKNIKVFHGKPIIAYSIEAARASRLFKSVVVSTDSEEVSEIAQDYGADVMMRGARWCGDEIGPLDVARHCLTLMNEVDLACVLYATAPLMRVADLIRGYKAMSNPGVLYACSVGTTPFLHDAAQFFWCVPSALKERVPEFSDNTVMIPIHPAHDCDINTEADWQQAEALYKALHTEAA